MATSAPSHVTPALGLDQALRTLHCDDGAAAKVVLDEAHRSARAIAARHDVPVDVMANLADELLCRLLRTPARRIQDGEKFISVCLMNAMRSWGRSRARQVRPLPASLVDEPARPSWTTPRSRHVPTVDREHSCFTGRPALVDPDLGHEGMEELTRTLAITRKLAAEHLNATDAATIDGLIAIHLERTTANAEADRLGITRNALQQRQTRARTKLSTVVRGLVESAIDERESDRLRLAGRLVEALRDRNP